ncbi:hypothetical protein [Mesorhizobium delmotii]|uniref:hypothetical protein n=1 Tax=Mesorhizobium delmotii TaxID=1631247 RepID=UPI0014030EFA|nr:hypothetical protein [Mesorhizobium delmotii]
MKQALRCQPRRKSKRWTRSVGRTGSEAATARLFLNGIKPAIARYSAGPQLPVQSETRSNYHDKTLETQVDTGRRNGSAREHRGTGEGVSRGAIANRASAGRNDQPKRRFLHRRGQQFVKFELQFVEQFEFELVVQQFIEFQLQFVEQLEFELIVEQLLQFELEQFGSRVVALLAALTSAGDQAAARFDLCPPL